MKRKNAQLLYNALFIILIKIEEIFTFKIYTFRTLSGACRMDTIFSPTLKVRLIDQDKDPQWKNKFRLTLRI